MKIHHVGARYRFDMMDLWFFVPADVAAFAISKNQPAFILIFYR